MEREGSLRWRVADHGRAILYGDMVEDVDFTTLLAQLRGHETVLELAEVRRINSIGVRELVLLFETIRASRRLILERCSPAIVNQLNMLPELAAGVEIRSVFAPMECPRCHAEKEHLVEVGHGGHGLSLVCKCDECGAEMDLSEPRERYFAFLEP